MKNLLKIFLAIILLPYFLFAQTEPTDTDGDGYRNVSTLDHLKWISQNSTGWGYSYELDNDINASDTRNWNDTLGFSPIGNDTTKFTGKFNGNGYKIDSLFINRTAQDYIGLFGYTQGAEIKNIGLTNANIKGHQYVGELVGYHTSSTISNSYSTGSVTGVSNYVGGLVGVNYNNSTISNSYSTGSVSGSDYVSGLVGVNYNNSIISNSYSTGSVTGNFNVGGLVGYNQSSSISNSYSTGSVTGDLHVGGLAGGNRQSATISNSYSTGSVTGSSSGVGGLVGYNGYSTISNSYSIGSVTGSSVNAGGFVGYNDSSTISNSYSTGSVTGCERVGGLVGHNYSNSTISNSYSTGSVTRSSGSDINFGGFCGYNNNSTIQYCYSIGSVNFNTDKGFVGGQYGTNTYTYNFFDQTTSGQTTGIGANEKTTAQMKTQSTFTNWNFDSTWSISSLKNNGYPYLQVFNISIFTIKPNIDNSITTDTIHFEWDGTEFDRYELFVDNNSGFGSPEVSPISIKDFLDYDQTSYTLCGNWLSQNKYYWKVIGYNGETEYESNIDSFLYVPQKSAKPNWQPIYRSFNKNVVDHFYTTSASHNNIAELQGYGFEAIEGHLSLTPFEINSDNGEELVAVYRFYIHNPSYPKYSRHFYVTDEAYKDSLIMQDYHIYEGIIGYTYKNYKQGLTKMYHSYLDDEINQRKDNFYTTKLPEFINSKRFGYDTTNFASFWVSESGNLDIIPELNFGIMSYQEPTVFNLPTGKMGLGFSFSYSSFNDFIGLKENPLGINWSHNYQSYSTIEPNSTKIKVYYAGGGIGFFNNSATYQRSTSFGDYNELKKEGNSIYLKTPTQTIFKYDFLDVNINTAYLTSITDRNGNQITLNYDTKQRLYSVSLYGRSLLFTYYESSGEQFSELIEKVTETGLNRSIKFEYDTLRNLVKYTDPNGNFVHYKYYDILPGWHTITEITMPNGNKIKYEYDDNRKIKSQTSTGETENNTTYTYNLDAATPNVQRKDAYNKITSIDFINSDRAIPNKVTSPSGEIVEIKWNVAHPSKPDTLINTKGKKTIFKYDNNGNVTETLLPMNIKYSFEYNSTNDLLKSVDPKGVVHKYIYDNSGNGNLIEDQAPLNRTTKFTYYSTGAKNGMVKDVTDVLNRKVQFEYNDLGNLTKQIDNIGNITQFNYDGASRLIESIDAKNNKYTNNYNNYDQLTKSINPLADEVNYTYDENGNLTKVTDPINNFTTNTFNSKDQLISVTNQLNQSVQFDYDLNNVVNKITKPSGDAINYTFWDDGKLKTKYWNNYSALFEYDNVSNLTKITDNNGTIEFTQFDDLNRLISTKDYWNNVISYTYDDNSNIKSIVYPGNKTVLYDYYDDNSLKSVKDWNGNESKYFYNLDGSLDSIWNQNGTTTKYKYDNNWRIIELINKKSNGEIINSYNYTLDNLGNQISVNKNEPIAAPLPYSEVTNYQYNAANRITSANNKSYNYDYNGNLSTENNSGVQSNYSFNVANQLLGITGSKSAQYLYDGLGNRVQTIKNSVTRKYIHDMNSSLNNLLMETDENGNVLNYYIYGLGLVSRIKANGTTNYYHYDSRGSTIAMTNSNQEITHKYGYGAYGEILSKTEADNNPFRFVGAYGVIDDENGLYYMRARYYDHSIGRFISEDPIWATNLYWYGDGNPVMGIDPEGLIIYSVYYIYQYSESEGGKSQHGHALLLFIDEDKNKFLFEYTGYDIQEYNKNGAENTRAFDDRMNNLGAVAYYKVENIDGEKSINYIRDYIDNRNAKRDEVYYPYFNDCFTFVKDALKQGNASVPEHSLKPGIGIKKAIWNWWSGGSN